MELFEPKLILALQNYLKSICLIIVYPTEDHNDVQLANSQHLIDLGHGNLIHFEQFLKFNSSITNILVDKSYNPKKCSIHVFGNSAETYLTNAYQEGWLQRHNWFIYTYNKSVLMPINLK